jgi:hypothetical protein
MQSTARRRMLSWAFLFLIPGVAGVVGIQIKPSGQLAPKWGLVNEPSQAK